LRGSDGVGASRLPVRVSDKGWIAALLGRRRPTVTISPTLPFKTDGRKLKLSRSRRQNDGEDFDSVWANGKLDTALGGAR